MMIDEPNYEEWIANRQSAEPPAELTDRVMLAIEERALAPNRPLQFADRMNQSRLARWAACLAASLVGSLPFLYVAHHAEMLVF